MYRSCIFCSAHFGSNDVLDTFPVGQRIAFDSWRGRLWTVCPLCASVDRPRSRRDVGLSAIALRLAHRTIPLSESWR